MYGNYGKNEKDIFKMGFFALGLALVYYLVKSGFFTPTLTSTRISSVNNNNYDYDEEVKKKYNEIMNRYDKSRYMDAK